MNESQFTEEQIMAVLREAGAKVQDICRKHGISYATFYKWRSKHENAGLPEARRLKQLEQENARLKKLVAERDLEIEVMKEIAAKKW